MGNYSEREVKVAIRRLNAAITDIISTSYATYKSKIDNFVELSNSDPIIKSIVEPFREVEVDYEVIHRSNNPYRIDEVNLPTDVNKRIAYIIQIFDEVTAEQSSLDRFAEKIYRNGLEGSLSEFLHDIAKPQLIELLHMLDDLLEDEVEGKEIISDSAFQFFNHGTIVAQQGSNIAIGNSNSQTTTYKNISNEIMEKVNESGLLTADRLSEVEVLAKKVQEEMNKQEPSPGKIKQLAGKVYEIGEQGLLKIFTTVVSDPRWGQAALEVLLKM